MTCADESSSARLITVPYEQQAANRSFGNRLNTTVMIEVSTETGIEWACPNCRKQLQDRNHLDCLDCRLSFEEIEGILGFLSPSRRHRLDQFIHEYETIRRAEGREFSPAQYRALPFLEASSRRSGEWGIRAATFRTFQSTLQEWKRERSEPLRACDLGAGNCWLSNRLALEGLQVAAVDLVKNSFDGLGCHCCYSSVFVCVEAEFDRLPFQFDQFDLAVFNASLHYSTDYRITLGEALRVLHPEGKIVVLDSPCYRDAQSGEQMVKERERHFERTYGCPSNSLQSEHFLTFGRLDDLAAELGLTWQRLRPAYGFKWRLQQWRESLFGSREPATFLMLVGTRD